MFWRSRSNGRWHCRCLPWWQRRRWHRILSHTMLPSVGQPRSGQQEFSLTASNSCYCFEKWCWNAGPNNSPESNSNNNPRECLSPNGPFQDFPSASTAQNRGACGSHWRHTLVLLQHCQGTSDICTFRSSETTALAGFFFGLKFKHCAQRFELFVHISMSFTTYLYICVSLLFWGERRSHLICSLNVS